MIPLFQFSQNMYYIHIQWYLIPDNVDFKYSFAFYFQYVTSLVPQVSSILCAPAAHRTSEDSCPVFVAIRDTEEIGK